MRHISHEIEFITGGNQKWKGASPSFIINPIKVRIINCSEEAPRRSRLDPRA